MSDTPPTPPTPADEPAKPDSAAPPKPKPSRARKWRIRLTRLIVAVIIIGLVFRALIYVLFPVVLRKVAGIYGLNASYDRMELYLLGGDVGLWGFKLTPSEGGDPFLTVSYCRGSISTIALLRGHLHVSRAEAEGAELIVDRTANGNLPLLDKFVAATSNAAPAATQPASSSASSISLDPPLFVETLRLQGAAMHFTDHSVKPVADVTMKLNMLVNNIGASQQKTSFAINLNSPQTLAALYVDGDGTTSDRQLDAHLNISMFGLNLLPAQQYLAPFGIVPTLKDISGKASGYFQAKVTGGSPDGKAPATQPANLGATLKLTGLSLSADSQPAASVGDVTVQAGSLSPGAIVIDQIAVDRVRAAASRTPEGRLSFAGVEFDPSAASDEPATQPATAAAPATQPAGPSSIPTVDLKQLKISDCEFAFTDGIFAPAVVLELNVPKVILEHISTDPAKAKQAATLELSANAPGIAQAIDIHGTAAPAAQTKTLNLTVTASGIDGSALDPYLAVFGLKRDLNDAKFACKLSTEFTPHENGSFTTGLELHDVALTQAGKSLLAMNAVELKNARIDPAAARISLGRVELIGPTLPLAHEKGNVFAALGLRFDPTVAKPQYASPPPPSAAAVLIEGATTKPTTQPTTVAAATSQPTPVALLGLPSISVDLLSWTGVGISLHDTSTDQPIDLGIHDLQLHGKGLVFDAAAKDAKPGTVAFSAKIPGVVEEVGLQGTIAPTGDSVAFDMKGDIGGISAERLKPLMQAFNLEPAMHAGRMVFSASGDVRQKNKALEADMKLADVKLTDGSRNWLTLGNLAVKKATFDGHVIAAEAIDVDSPSAIAQRDAEGGISIAGVRLVPSTAAPTTQPMAGAATLPVNVEPIAALPFVGRLGAFNLHKAQLQWGDDSVAPAAEVRATIDLSAQNLAVGEVHAPSPFTLSLTSPNLIEQLKVDGTVQASPATQGITFNAVGSGLTGTAINTYLPPNFGMIFKGAAVHAKGMATLRQNPAGGLSAKVQLEDAALTDAGMNHPLGGVGSMVIDIDRLDLSHRIIAINELSLEHAQLEAWQWNGGASVLGLAFCNTPLRVPKAPREVAEQQAGDGVSDVGTLMAQAMTKPPLVTIKKLVLHADSLAVISSQLGRKLELTNSSVWCPGSIELLGDQPQKNPPFELRAYATIDPLIGQLNADAVLAPFAADPFAKADFSIVGLHGDKLTTVLPQLASLINGDDLKNGRVTASGEAHFKFTRRGALGIDLTRDIGADAELKNIRLTEDGVADPLAGLDGLRIDNLRYTPTGSAFIKTLEITKPMLQVVRDKEGIHAFGLTAKIGVPPATQPATVAATTAPATTLPTTVAIAPPTQPATLPVALGPTSQPQTTSPDLGPEYRIDKLIVSGIDLRLEDHLGSSHTVIPVNDLDIEVKGLTNRALTEPNMPIRFSLLANAGKVELPVRKPTDNGPLTDERPVFAEVSANGNITMVPKPVGYLKAAVSGFELTSIRGLASQYGVTITGGTFDGRVDVRMNGGDSFVAKVYPTLNEARLREGDNGPIRRIFQLPSPVDVVISTIEDQDGSITLPFTVPIEAGKLDTGTIVSSAVGSASGVILNAMVAAPLKAAKLATLLLGGDASSARTKAIPPIDVSFAAGESQLSADQWQQLQSVIEMMRKDKTLNITLQHTLGSGDVELAQTRVNPLKQDTTALAAQYRKAKFDLQKQLSQQTGAARVAMATDRDTVSSLDQLRATAVQLNETEDALDQVLELLRPGADRQAERRTKQAAILLGELRLTAVQSALLSSGLPNIDKRIARGPAKFNAESGDGKITLTLTHQAKS